jgi:hypothetical protein
MRSTLVVALFPHLISAGTIPAGLLERVMEEPLAEGRDEVVYLICTHPRVGLGTLVDGDGWRNVYGARGPIGGPFSFDYDQPWARIRLPSGVRPSALGWAVLDPQLEAVEGLVPDASFDASRDPEGAAGRHRQELLAWIFDRHLGASEDVSVDRGEVDGGEIEFRLEYIGKAQRDALRRAAGAHHKMPLILQRTLLYSPHRLVYVLPCDIRAATYDASSREESVPMGLLAEAVTETGLSRDLLIAAAEEAVIAEFGAPENERNSRERRFPRSDAGDRLRARGIADMIIGVFGLPKNVHLRGQRRSVTHGSKAIKISLDP